MTYKVSTHSRPKAAATNTSSHFPIKGFQHTAARRRLSDRRRKYRLILVSTHSRPKAAEYTHIGRQHKPPFQHTAARRRLNDTQIRKAKPAEFQHTAARRRLLPPLPWQSVS